MNIWPFNNKKELTHPLSPETNTNFLNWPFVVESYDPTETAGKVEENSIVAAAISWAIRTWNDADLEVERNDVPVENHPLLALLREPNSYQSGDVLFSSALQSLMVNGNAYWYKDRNVFGSPFQLWNINARLIKPIGTASEFISYYEYRVNGKLIKLPIEDIIHFRMGEDPDDPRLGFSALRSVVREIAADNSASLYSGAVLKNGGMPSLLFAPKTGSMTPENAEYLLSKWKQKYSKEKSGLVGFLPEAMDLLTLGFSPDKMAITESRKTPEERICSVLGISPMVLGLSAGLANSTFSNYEQAREAAYESFVLPMQAIFEGEINRHLMPELGLPNDEFEFNNDEVSALSEDQNDLATRAATLYAAGIISKAVAKEMVGIDPDPQDINTYAGVNNGPRGVV